MYLTGYTPYPQKTNDPRLPHIAEKLTKQISKTALGAETSQTWEQSDTIEPILSKLKADGYTLIGLEQTQHSTPLNEYQPPTKVALLLGREVEGIALELVKLLDATLEIPMYGTKESFNVVQAAAMSLYHLRFTE